MAANINLQGSVYAAGNGMLAHGIVNDPVFFICVLGQAVKKRIDPTHTFLVKIKLVHAWPPQV
jgi:hypothetical protein